ncbi:MAG: hypothetical protein FWH22_07310 [Fibromonadales bacterium]|nr:hypothetical protein [Fibromonadales bacterium]
MFCSFCLKSEPVRIEINALNLRICPNCLSTFLPAAQFAALRRELNDSTKKMWVKKLAQAIPCDSPSAPLKCLEHNVPLAHGEIPNYSFEGLVPSCCDLQHLPPSLMAKILEMGIGSSVTSICGLGVSRRKPNPVSEFLGGIVFRFWERSQKNTDDGLDRLQYNFKFKDILGEWIDE